jgi:hypothetical protein
MANRREFILKSVPVATLGLTAALSSESPASPAAGEKTAAAYFELQSYRLHTGPQVGHLLGWLEKRAVPILDKSGAGPVGVFTVEIGANNPAVLVLTRYSSLAQLEAAKFRVSESADWDAALAELEVDGESFYRLDSAVLRATSFCPPVTGAATGDSGHGFFELRIYESPTQKQLHLLHNWFADSVIDLFRLHGIHPVLYADTIVGLNQPNMVYLVPFESEDQRQKAWSAFHGSPAFAKSRSEAFQRGGSIVRNTTNMLLVPASFSMIR